jgi:hypothetical protein
MESIAAPGISPRAYLKSRHSFATQAGAFDARDLLR